MNQYWIQLLYVHIMVAEVSHSSRPSTCDTSVNIMHIINVMLSGPMVIHQYTYIQYIVKTRRLKDVSMSIGNIHT